MNGDKGRTRLRRWLIISYLTEADERKCTQWFTHNRPKLIRDNSAARLIYSQYSPVVTEAIYAVWHNTSFHQKTPITHSKILHILKLEKFIKRCITVAKWNILLVITETMTFKKPEQLCTWSGPKMRVSQYFKCNRLSQPTEQHPFKCNSLWTPVSLKNFLRSVSTFLLCILLLTGHSQQKHKPVTEYKENAFYSWQHRA